METALVQLISSIVGYLAARGVDKIVGKWVAYFTIAFEKSASTSARGEYRTAITRLSEELPKKYPEWADWRKGVTNGPNGSP